MADPYDQWHVQLRRGSCRQTCVTLSLSHPDFAGVYDLSAQPAEVRSRSPDCVKANVAFDGE